MYSAREAEFSKPETQERQVIKGGWLRFTKARYLPNCQSEHHTEGDTSIGLAVTEWCMPCRFLDERFFTFRILTFVCCLRKEGKVGEGVHRHPRTTPQWTRTTPSPRREICGFWMHRVYTFLDSSSMIDRWFKSFTVIFIISCRTLLGKTPIHVHRKFFFSVDDNVLRYFRLCILLELPFVQSTLSFLIALKVL